MPNLCQLSRSCFAPAQALDVTRQEQQATQHLIADLAGVHVQSVNSPATGYIEQHLAYAIYLIKIGRLTSPTESCILEELAGLCMQNYSQYWHALL